MGLFSSKYVTTVGTNISRVIPDDAYIPSHKSGALKAIFDKGNFSDYVMEDIISGMGFRGKRYYKYGETHYIHGLPSGEYLSSSKGRTELLALLSGEGAVSLDYHRIGPLNYLHKARIALTTIHGLNTATNVLSGLTASTNYDVFLTDIQIAVPAGAIESYAPESFEFWGRPASYGPSPARAYQGTASNPSGIFLPLKEDKTITTVQAVITYAWMETKDKNGKDLTVPLLKEGFMLLPLEESDKDLKDLMQVSYAVGGVTKYKTYVLGNGQYPTLDALLTQGKELNAEFYPFAYLRYNKKATNEDKTTEEYKSTKKLLKTINVDFDQLADAINENPDIEDVEQAMLMYMVPANTTNPLEQRYLFDFFERMYFAMDNQFTDPFQEYLTSFIFRSNPTSRNVMLIQDKQFKLQLCNNGIYKKQVVGQIGPIGTHSSALEKETVVVEAVDSEGYPDNRSYKVEYHVYKKQTATGIYEEIKVRSLKTKFFVWEDYSATGDGDNDILLVPLDSIIVNTYSIRDREALLSRSLHYIFNSRIVTKLKWYEQEWFSFVMIIVSIVITIVTYGAAWQGTAAALAAGTVTLAAVIMSAVIGLMKYLVFQIAFKIFIKAVGVKFAFFLAIAAAIVGLGMGINAGSIAGAPWATELMSLSTGLTSGIQNQIKSDYKSLEKDYNSFSEYTKEAVEGLEAANELLKVNSMAPLIIFGETPDQFFNRTSHSGNIGMLGIDSIEYYVTSSLALPTFQETIKGFDNASI